MIIRDLLSVLPKYSDNSGYDVVINFRTRNRGSWLDWDGVRLGSIEEKNLCYIYPFKSCDENLFGIETHEGEYHTDEELDELCCNTRDVLLLDD